MFRSGERQNPRAKFSHAVSKTSSKQSAEAAELIRLFVFDVKILGYPGRNMELDVEHLWFPPREVIYDWWVSHIHMRLRQ